MSNSRELKTMNIYEYQFITVCPNDGEKINYSLQVESDQMIMAEHIVETCRQIKGFQEAIASELKEKIGGNVKLTGTHSGVRITSIL